MRKGLEKKVLVCKLGKRENAEIQVFSYKQGGRPTRLMKKGEDVEEKGKIGPGFWGPGWWPISLRRPPAIQLEEKKRNQHLFELLKKEERKLFRKTKYNVWGGGLDRKGRF